MDCQILYGLKDCGIWHSWYSITLTPPFVPKVCQKGLGRLHLDCVDCIWIMSIVLDCTSVFGLYKCIWIVRLYLDCAIVFGLYNCGIWHRGCSITYTPPPVPKVCAKKDLVDCIWMLSIAFGLCRLHVDCFDCLWINTRPEADLQTPSSRVKERSERDGGVQRSASGLVLPWPLARIWPLALHRLGLSLSQNVFFCSNVLEAKGSLNPLCTRACMPNIF